MFEGLSDRLSRATAALKGRGRLSEENIRDAMRQVRMALLEADVALPVVREFTGRVKERAVGTEISSSLRPGQALVKIIHDELIRVMGVENEELDLKSQRPVIVLLAGLQGAGKTTTAAKLARWLIERQGKSVVLATTDVYRPAAIQQLEQLATQAGAAFERCESTEDPVEITRRAVENARLKGRDVLILDTAGRLHVDQNLMDEVRQIHELASPQETLFVVDSMAGQDAVTAAAAFDSALPLTGVILTKTDGDARGGVALSVRQVTGKPIKFLGVGEKIDALEPFHPERVASRILGMGDVVSLVEEVERKVDRKSADRLAHKIRKGKGFSLIDLREQLAQMQQMGGLASLMDKLPGMQAPAGGLPAAMGDQEIKKQIAVIDSMTPGERRFPKVINGSRKRRIASGAGVQIQEVNRLLKRHIQMQKMMKKMGRGGMGRMMKSMKGKLPPGLGF